MTTSEWLPVFLAWAKGQNEHRHEFLRTAQDVYDGIRERRKAYLGTGLSLEAVVQPGGRINHNNIRALCEFLSVNADGFLRMKHPDDDYLELFETFFFYGLTMYATGRTAEECFDDLILMAECYENSLDVYRIVMEENLPKDMIHDMQEWVEGTEVVPFQFSRYVTAAVAALLGVLPASA